MRERLFSQILALFLILSSSAAALAQELQVKGTITSSEDQEAVIGATISVKGTTTGTVSDADGQFSLKVPRAGSVLVISYLGMRTQEVAVHSAAPLSITLQSDSKVLESVVVTALGIKRSQKALGYATQTVSGDAIQKVQGAELATALSGKVAGLKVQSPSDFGAVPELSLRGKNPIIVIDDVPYENKKMSDLAAEDIQSITTLKGATASALYGSRGEGGAIIITTKGGKSGTKGLTIELVSNTMFSAGHITLPEKQSIYGRGSENIYDKNSPYSWGPKMEGQMLEQWDPFLKEYRVYEYLPVGKDNFDNFLQQGYVTNNNASVAYFNENASVRSSLNWTQNNGQYPNQKIDRYNYTLRGDIKVDKFKLSSSMGYARRHTPNLGSNGYTSYDPMYVFLIRSASDYNLLDYKNNYWVKKDEIQNYTYRSEQNNPYFDAYQKTNEFTRDIFNADLTLNYDFSHWLKLTARSGVDFFADQGTQRISIGSYVSTGNTPIPGNQWTWNGTTTGGYNTGQTKGFSMNNDFMLTGDNAFGKLNAEYLLGTATSYKRDQTLYAMTQGGISIPGFYSLAASVNPISASEELKTKQVNSVYGRFAISWERLLFAEFTGRNDWSSTMASTTTKSYFYPSVSTSFVVSELIPGTKDWLDMLKLRGSWTVTKKPADIYATNSVYSINNIWGTQKGASYPDLLQNANLKPETDGTFEVGMQGMAFKDRIMLDVAYYQRKTYDLLVKKDLSDATGYYQTYINPEDQYTTKGLEIALTGTPIKTKDFQWDLGVNWTKFATYWTKIDYRFTAKDNPFKKVGERTDLYLNADFLYDNQGNMIISNGLPERSKYNSKFGYKDPNFVWGINSTFTYKDFTLFVSFDGVVGGLMDSRTESYMWQNGVHPKSATDARLNPYLAEGVKVVSGSVEYDQYGNIHNDTRVYAKNDVTTSYQDYINRIHSTSAWGGGVTPFDAYAKTYFKFRELSLTYNLPRTFLSKYKLKGASIGFTGQNLMLWAKDFKYSDPDGGKEDFSDPAVRYLGGNIKLTF